MLSVSYRRTPAAIIKDLAADNYARSGSDVEGTLVLPCKNGFKVMSHGHLLPDQVV